MPNAVLPDTPQRALADRLNNVLTGIAVKCGLLQTRTQDPLLLSDLEELESLAKEAVTLVRQLRNF